jgi:hypothetical protein
VLQRVPHSSSIGWSPSACVPMLTWSDCCFDFGQHRLHHHPHLYTCLSTCPSPSCPRSILWPSVPRSKLHVCPSPLSVHRTQTPCLTFSIAIDRLTLNTCTLQRKVWTRPNDPKPRKGKERRSLEMSKLGPQRHEQWLDATKKKQSLVPNDMSKSSTEPSKRARVCLVLSQSMPQLTVPKIRFHLIYDLTCGHLWHAAFVKTCMQCISSLSSPKVWWTFSLPQARHATCSVWLFMAKNQQAPSPQEEA